MNHTPVLLERWREGGWEGGVGLIRGEYMMVQQQPTYQGTTSIHSSALIPPMKGVRSWHHFIKVGLVSARLFIGPDWHTEQDLFTLGCNWRWVWCLESPDLVRVCFHYQRCIAGERSDWYGRLWGAMCSVTVSPLCVSERLLTPLKNVTADFISFNGFYQARNTDQRNGSVFPLLHNPVGAEAEEMTEWLPSHWVYFNPLYSIAGAECPPVLEWICAVVCDVEDTLEQYKLEQLQERFFKMLHPLEQDDLGCKRQSGQDQRTGAAANSQGE